MAMKKPVKKAAKGARYLTEAESKAMAKGKIGQKRDSRGATVVPKGPGGHYGQGRVKFNYVTETEKKANTARRLNPKKK